MSVCLRCNSAVWTQKTSSVSSTLTNSGCPNFNLVKMAKESHLDENNNRSDTLVLFDVDGTLTPSRLNLENDTHEFLQQLKSKVTVGLVGGSDIFKIASQMLPPSMRSVPGVDPIKVCTSQYDYVFAENGLVAYKGGDLIAKQSLIEHLGEMKLQKFINFCLQYMSTIELPVKRGNFIEFRTGLINVCPVGRSCSQAEREQFNNYDKKHKIRETFVQKLNEKFGPNGDDPLDLVYSIGGQISFDAFPRGWDKTFCLKHIDSKHREIYFFGDKTQPGGNDHEIYADPRTIGCSVKSPADTLDQLRALKLVDNP